jgi:hypothetical protein
LPRLDMLQKRKLSSRTRMRACVDPVRLFLFRVAGCNRSKE